MDVGQIETEKLIALMMKEVKDIYTEAREGVKAKFIKFNVDFARKDIIKQRLLTSEKITQQEYIEWRTNQTIMSKRWKKQLDVLSTDLTNAQQIATSIIRGYMPEAYAMGHNYGTFQVENITGIDTSYTLYDRQTVEKLIREKPKLLPDLKPQSKTAKDIAAGKIKKWEEKQIQSVCLQGILQGESVPKIAERISDITLQDASATERYARTMTTGAENAGRVDSYHRAEEMGVELQQTWIATLDSRTRHSHRMMDGETVPVGKKFSNGCKFPGDPNGPAQEIWNCRCTLVTRIKGFEIDYKDLSLRNTSKMEEKSYEEWKAGKYKPKPKPKQKQKKKKGGKK